MPRLNEVAKKVAAEAVSAAAAPVVLTGDVLKSAVSRGLQAVNPLNHVRIPGMDILKMMAEMRNNLKTRMIGKNDNDNDMKEIAKTEKKQTESLNDSLHVLKDIKKILDDLLHMMVLKNRREIREKKLQKYRNIDFDVGVDKAESVDKKKFSWKKTLGTFVFLKKAWDKIAKWLLPAGVLLAMGLKKVRIAMLNTAKAVLKGVSKIAKMPGRIIAWTKNIGNLLERFSRAFPWLSKTLSRLNNIFRRLPFRNIMKSAGRFARAFRGFGRYTFVPLTAMLFGIYDFVKGFTKSYSKDGRIMKAVWAGMKNVINGFVFMPLDLLKDISSWAAKKMGFNNVSKKLDSFSFQNMYKDFTKKVEDMVYRGFEYAKDIYKDVKKRFSDIFSRLKKKIMDKMPSWESFKQGLDEKWQDFLKGIENTRQFLVDLWNSPGKAWNAIKKKFPDMNKLIEDMKKKIPSFEDIKKSLTNFDLSELVEGIKESVRLTARSIALSLPWGDKIVASIDWLKDPKMKLKGSGEDVKTDMKKLEVLSKTYEFKEFTKKREVEKQFPKFPPIILQDNKKIIHQNSMNGPHVSDPTPQSMLTTSYTSRWETN